MLLKITGLDLNLAIGLGHVLGFSLSLPPGTTDLARFSLTDAAGQPQVWQQRVLNRHPDGTIRNAYVRFVPAGKPPFALSTDGAGHHVSAAPASLGSTGDGRVRAGCFELVLPTDQIPKLLIRRWVDGAVRDWAIDTQVQLWDGQRIISAGTPETVEIEEDGPVWCSVVLSGAYGSSPDLRYQLRLQVALDQPVLYWQFRVENPNEDQVKIRSVQLVVAPLAVAAPRALICQGEAEAILRQNGEERPVHQGVPDYLTVEADGDSICWGMRNLAQLYPKALVAEEDMIRWDVVPPGVPGEKLHYTHQEHQRGYWFDEDGGMRIPPRMAWRTDGFMTWGPQAESLATVAVRPPLVTPVALPGTPWSGVVGVGPNTPEAVQIEADRLLASYLHTQRECRFFGLMDFGDEISGDTRGVRDGYGIWANGEHDGSFGPLLYYLVSGKRDYWDAGYAVARHQMDIDTRRKGKVWLLAKHCVGHITDSCQNGHFWLEGLILYYRLTGDEDAREVLEHMCEWLLQDTSRGEPGRYPTIREIGKSLWMLAEAYSLFPERQNLMEIMVSHVDALLAMQEDTGAWHPYPGTADAIFKHPRYRKNLHLSIFAMGMTRYGQVSGDPRVPEALHRFLRNGLIGGELLLPDGTGFYYQNMYALDDLPESVLHPDRRAVPGPYPAGLFPYLEVVAYVHQHHPDQELLEKARYLLDCHLARQEDKGTELVRSYVSWTPMLQHLPPFLGLLVERP
jgi:hypothetical protein